MQETDNEITIRIICSKDELIDLLESKGCKFDRAFRLDDTYFVPGNEDLSQSARKLLAKAIIVRVNSEGENITRELTYKIKEFADDGSITAQQKYNCLVLDENDAKELLKAMGYKELFRVIEDDLVYIFDGIGLVIKDVQKIGLLMEIETREGSNYETINSLKELVKELNIPMQNGEYFIKKAELCL